MQYRKEIDGLRAVAVVPVIFAHSGFKMFAGGFVGVDIFFVISGYLITSILIEDIENNKFSLLNFYERRARRILPALFFVMLCCLPFAWFWMLPNQLKDFSQSLIAVSFFASNVLFWKESGYFDAAAEEKPLLHTWSLAVEEQYYLLFPIFLFLAWRFGKQRVFWLIVIFSVISLTLSEWGWRHKPSANFYLAPTRAWELFAGSIAAFIVQQNGVRAHNIFSVFGLIAVVASIFIYDSATPFPSAYALLPVVGVVLIILFGRADTVVGKILSNPLLVGMGLISYSAYLWHQPLFAFARIRSIEKPSISLMLALSFLSIVLAVISWKFVEQPARNKNSGFFKSRKRLIGFSVAGTLAFCSLGLWGHVENGATWRLPKNMQALAQGINDVNPYINRCQIDAGDVPQHPLAACTDFFVGETASVVFVGDSHSDAISYQAQKLLFEHTIGSYAVAYAGCIGLPGFYRVDQSSNHKCAEYNKGILDYAREVRAKTIVITSRFPLYLYGKGTNQPIGRFEKTSSGFVDTIAAKSQRPSGDDAARRQRVLDGIADKIIELAKEFNVVLVLPVPEAGMNVPMTMINCERFGQRPCEISPPISAYHHIGEELNSMFNKIQNDKFHTVDARALFCTPGENGKCVTSIDGKPLYFDDHHLANSTGAKMLAPLILDAVKNAQAN